MRCLYVKHQYPVLHVTCSMLYVFMFPMLKTPAFIIKKHNFREFDRIYTVYTEEMGKVSLLVRSARKIKSKLSPSLENFSEVRINFIKGRIFNHLAGAIISTKYNKILKDNNRIFFARGCFDLIDKFIKADEKDEKIFALIKEIISGIDNRDISEFKKIEIYFFWKLIDMLGYRPRLDKCALCGKMIKGRELLFNITDNIIICRKCAGQGVLIKEKTLEDLKKVFRLCLNDFVKLKIDSELIAITGKAKQIKLSEL